MGGRVLSCLLSWDSIRRRRDFCKQRAGLEVGSWRNWAVETRKFAIRVRKGYCRGGSPDSAAGLRIGLERNAPRANLIADDWIELNNLKEDVHTFWNIGVPYSIRESIMLLYNTVQQRKPKYLYYGI